MSVPQTTQADRILRAAGMAWCVALPAALTLMVAPWSRWGAQAMGMSMLLALLWFCGSACAWGIWRGR